MVVLFQNYCGSRVKFVLHENFCRCRSNNFLDWYQQIPNRIFVWIEFNTRVAHWLEYNNFQQSTLSCICRYSETQRSKFLFYQNCVKAVCFDANLPPVVSDTHVFRSNKSTNTIPVIPSNNNISSRLGRSRVFVKYYELRNAIICNSLPSRVSSSKTPWG